MQRAQERAIAIPGGKLCVRIWGSGAPVVLIPATARGASDFEELAEALGSSGFSAIGVNPRGVEGSTGTHGSSSLHDFASDIAAVLAALGHSRSAVIGHAFGNRVARCFAADYPRRTEAVILLAAGGRVRPDPSPADRFFRTLQADLSSSEFREAMREANFSPESDPAPWFDGWWPAAAPAQLAAARGTDPDAWWSAGEAPVLILQGLHDATAPPENGRLLKQELGPRATLVELDATGHAVLLEQSKRVAEEVIAFLDGLRTAAQRRCS